MEAFRVSLLTERAGQGSCVVRRFKEGLDAAVTRGNVILRQFAVTHGAAASGEI
jgi:hypothetical protein